MSVSEVLFVIKFAKAALLESEVDGLVNDVGGTMKKSALMKLPALLIAAVIIASTFLLPSYGFAQGKGHGRGLSKKSTKFVNRHDARNGRWDGRGPKKPKRLIGKRVYRGQGKHKGWTRRR
jgi:hypothetical protein